MDDFSGQTSSSTSNDVGLVFPFSRCSHTCPCLLSEDSHEHRFLVDGGNVRNDGVDGVDGVNDGGDGDDGGIVIWEVVYTCLVLLFMFAALISDKMGADMVMLSALTLCMCSGIISIEEGLVGFANEGLITVLVLFVVADGISRTGALDWYMGKLLGRPKSLASAQLRLMIPIAVVSAFLNNTPVVAVMIPIVQKWGKNIGISPQQLLIPLSFASILGGTCTLIGTSTNLVVQGLLQDRYPKDATVQIGLFDLGQFGVPIAICGISYILLLSPWLLPGGTATASCCNKNIDATGARRRMNPLDDHEDVLLGAKVTPWSPAAGRSVKRSGLRDTGGIYLVSVYRASTGNVHRAVGQEFVLNVGDVLYFTGLIDSFGDFCEEQGLEVFTNEVQQQQQQTDADADANAAIVMNQPNPNNTEEETDPLVFLSDNNNSQDEKQKFNNNNNNNSHHHNNDDDIENTNTNNNDDYDVSEMIKNSLRSSYQEEEQPKSISINFELSTIRERRGGGDDMEDEIPFCEIGVTKDSLSRAPETDRMRMITRLTDSIRRQPRNEPTNDEPMMPSTRRRNASLRHDLLLESGDPSQIVVTTDQSLVVVAVNCRDRAGLLLDISKSLLTLNLQLRHTEASVVFERSISIWRCEPIGVELPDIEQIWSVLNALLEAESGIAAVKKRGLRVIRVRVTEFSSLIGRTAAEVNFRTTYEAAIVAIQKGGKNVNNQQLSITRFEPDDVLILQAADNSPVLLTPPDHFYKKLAEESSPRHHHNNKFTALLPRKNSKTDLHNPAQAIVNLVNRIGRSNSTSDMTTTTTTGGGGEDVDREKQHSGRSTVAKSDEDDNNDNDDNDNKSMTNCPGKGNNNNNKQQSIPPSLVEDESDNNFYIGGIRDDDDDDDNDDNKDVINTDSEEVSVENNTTTRKIGTTGNEEAVWKDIQVLASEGDSNAENGVSREFLTAMTVAPNSQLAGKSVIKIGINKLPGVVLVTIERPNLPRGGESDVAASSTKRNQLRLSYAHSDAASFADDLSSIRSTVVEQTLTTILPDEPLSEGDILWFAGSASSIGDLRKIPGLLSYQDDQVEKIGEKVFDRRLVQAVVAKSGPLVGKTVKEVQFRTRYGAAVIAVHRDGNRIHDHPGKVKLQAGDVLLLEAGSTFIARSSENDRSFALLAEVKDSAPPRLRLYVPALIITAAMLIVYTIGIASLLICALVACMLMVGLGILSEQEARDAVNWDVFITIASAFGIGATMVNSGVAGGIADFLVDVGEALGIGDAGLFGAVYLATFLISNVVTNNAAAALLFPIAMDAAEEFGTDVKLMSYCLMLGASASFMSPFGYTTNLLIYGPGGYKYNDFVFVGTPMQVVLWILSVSFLSIPGWWPSWVATLAFFLVVVAFTVFKNKLMKLSPAARHSEQENPSENKNASSRLTP